MSPLVSVCIPTYNHAHLLGDALRSATAQSFRDLEVLVLDNGSTDDTERVMRELLPRDGRARYIRHARNLGMVANFNACIAEARGQYIKFICADDTLEPECVARMVQVMVAHPRVTLAACARRFVDGESRPASSAGYARRFLVTGGAAAIRRCFFHGNVIGEPTAVMFRRADAERGFDAGYRQLIDLELWLHLLGRGELAFLPEVLCSVRRHAEQATVRHLESGVVLEDKRRLYREFAGAATGAGASLLERLMWDARMAVTVHRTRKAGHAVDAGEVEEVFFPGVFPGLTFRVAPALWELLRRDS